MYINRVRIENFKSFKNPFNIFLNEGLNILVGNNDSGKSTILEAIHLTLSGLLNGKYIKNELTEFLFNAESVKEYLQSLKTSKFLPAPEIKIEVFIAGENLPFFEGDGNTDKKHECGIAMKIALADVHIKQYNEYISSDQVSAIPVEFYEVTWTTCARESITPWAIPIKSALIDSSSTRFRNGSDVYISHIIKNNLDELQRNSLAHAHRRLQSSFLEDNAVVKVNNSIIKTTKKNDTDKEVKLTIDLSSKDAWESSLITSVDDIPFHHIGKGEQSIIKTKLALEHKKAQEANLILLEEPENHLTHSKLNQLIEEIHSKCNEKQILISTHSSFVANKLGLDNLILLNDKIQLRLTDLRNKETQKFFEKIPGYDTLRLILCKKAILVEGDSDELIVQRAYRDANNGKLPIQDQIDVISVGTSFLRFLQIAEKISKPVCVVTDNDGKLPELMKKYVDYLGPNAKPTIKICYDENVYNGELNTEATPFNYNTLEPNFIRSNGFENTKSIIFGKDSKKTENDLHIYMRSNKTDCALKIFDTIEKLVYPKYILDAITN